MESFIIIARLTPLLLAPLTVAGCLLTVLLAFQYFDRLDGLLACWVSVVWFSSYYISLLPLCWRSGFWMLVSRPFFRIALLSDAHAVMLAAQDYNFRRLGVSILASWATSLAALGHPRWP